MKLRIPLGRFDVVSFTGPDAVRFLNGQLTQDVQMVAAGASAAFSCVTDAKGRLQFRIVIAAKGDGAIHAAVPAGQGEALKARLTRYLIADDVEATLTPAPIEIHHFIGGNPPDVAGIIPLAIDRLGEPGWDWWLPAGHGMELPAEFETCEGDAFEALRITRGIPAWESEITEGMLPPEARLETTDISYRKGCYIGQEVISRIKSAGKVNRMLTRFSIDGDRSAPGPIIGPDGKEAGVVTSITPGPPCLALGYLKRTAPASGLTLQGAEVRIR